VFDTNDFLIYNGGTGKLFYDANGSSAGADVEVAIIGAGLALTSAGFLVM
jgi:hypothetical protein